MLTGAKSANTDFTWQRILLNFLVAQFISRNVQSGFGVSHTLKL